MVWESKERIPDTDKYSTGQKHTLCVLVGAAVGFGAVVAVVVAVAVAGMGVVSTVGVDEDSKVYVA